MLDTINSQKSEMSSDNLTWMISDLISSYVTLQDVPYSLKEEREQQVDPESVEDASMAIVRMLRENGLLSDISD